MSELRRSKVSKKRPSVWRAAFFTLLFLVVIALAVLAAFLTGGFSTSKTSPENFTSQQTSDAIFTVQANKKQLQSMINQQIADNKDKRLNYHVEIGDQVVLKGSYRLLFTGIPFSLSFAPEVNNGDIILKETNVRLGNLKLPDQEVLAFLKSGTRFPKWVVIQPSKRQVYINLTRVQVQKGLYLHAETINLPGNDVSFTVHQKAK
ncbi:MAG: YpmS family protein [Sporolactobacillus sp.]